MHSNSNPFTGYMLIPHYFKRVGGILLLFGSLLTYLWYGSEMNPKLFDCKVFAVYSAYFKTRWFAIIDNNIIEELCGIMILIGLFMIAFAREKDEIPHYIEIRFKALMISVILSTAMILFSFLFIYGTAFLAVMIFNTFLPLVLYILLFFFMLYKYKYENKDKLI